ncbi:hypothetical protein ACM9XA_11310 [Xanthomonas sacchari]
MLDVHVLTLPGLPDAWIEQRRASIAAAVEAAGYPVTIHEVDGIDGHLGQSRERGYSLGTAEYVTHVDHDDYVHADAFSVLKDALLAGVQAVTTGETVLRPDGSMTDMPQSRHHLAVFRRDLLDCMQYAAMRMYPDQYLLSQVASTHIDQCVYVHRIYADSASRRQRAVAPDDALRELAIIADERLVSAEMLTREQIERVLDREIGHV